MRQLRSRLRRLLERDTRYRWEAYEFVQESLVQAQQLLVSGQQPWAASDDPDAPPFEPHLTGQQLCDALRVRALDQYGYLAKTVLNRWGIRATSDIGDIVYNLIAIDWLKKSNSDRREDFNEVFDFDTVFRQDFRINVESQT